MADPIEMLMQDLGWPSAKSSRPPSDVVVARAWAAADGVVAVTVEIRADGPTDRFVGMLRGPPARQRIGLTSSIRSAPSSR
jgi:hypothetical protein